MNFDEVNQIELLKKLESIWQSHKTNSSECIPFSVYSHDGKLCYSLPIKNDTNNWEWDIWRNTHKHVQTFLKSSLLLGDSKKAVYGTTAALTLRIMGKPRHLLVDAAKQSSFEMTLLTTKKESIFSFVARYSLPDIVIGVNTIGLEDYHGNKVCISLKHCLHETILNDCQNAFLKEAWPHNLEQLRSLGVSFETNVDFERDEEKIASLIWMAIHYWKQVCISYCEQHIDGGTLLLKPSVLVFVSSSPNNSNTGLLVPYILNERCDDMFVSQLVAQTFFAASLLGHAFLQSIYRSEERARLNAAHTESAIGAIMARNGSHNIGSHVLSALSHNVGTMPDDRVLYQYIQHRMDYIASATTGAPDWSVPTPFVGNLMKMFYSQRHLLDHIAESDGLHAYQYQGKGTQIGDGQNDCVKIIVRRISHREGEIVGEKEVVKEKNVFGKTVYMYEFFQETPSTSEDSDNANKTEKNGDASLKENVDETVKPVKWENDEAVSVPGGVLGQHAFYNVVENILRNAAKHSWAGKSKAEREQAKNLEIYVDFEKDQPDGTMWFTVGDNMSKLFPGDFWQKFFDEVKKPQKNQEVLAEQSWVKEFAEPLDGFAVPKEEDVKKLPKGVSRREYIEHFLADDEKYPDSGLPPHYKALYDYVAKKWTFLKDNPDFLILLRGKDPNDPKNPNEKLGHRLPLPLHHRQEIALSEPFIDLETNRLRQSAWGLSEMKISAGYLRRAKVSVIGGLEQPKFGEHPLIVPLGVPRSGKKDVQWDDMCLAYRFWVKLPKDVLIVADNPIQWERFTQWEGIGVESYDRVFGCVDRQGKKKDHVGLMSDYGFVLVDHANRKGKREDDDKLKLPFRALEIMDGAQTGAWGLPCALASTLKEARTRKDFVEYVYSVWLGWLQKRRAPEATESDLTIKLNIYDEKGGEKGLISDRDIYKVLFRECLHSVLEPIVVNYQIGNFDAWQRKALLLVSMYPLNEDDDLFGSVKEKEGDHVFRIEGLLVKIAQKVRQFWMSLPCSQEMNCGKTQQVLGAYRESLNRAKYSSIRPFALELLAELDSVQDNAGNGVDPLLCQALDDLSKKPPKITILGEAVKALDIARTTSDVFLRKYEERISTLPSQYKGTKQPKKPKLNFGAFGVNIFCRDTGEDIDISYNRHSTDGARLYSEPLSGSQTYLNALSNLSDDDSQWAMRLAENGLLRIAIIDERVRAFIAEHGDDIKKTYVAMHIAVVDTEIKPDFDSEKAILPDLTKLQFLVRNARDADFDLVVIHQGIIDKWWPNKHRQTDVADILSSLRQSGGSVHSRFVVVTTGRGRPDNIPETAKVLAFSSIEAFLFKRYPEKLNLVNSLMSILPGSPERNDDHD